MLSLYDTCSKTFVLQTFNINSIVSKNRRDISECALLFFHFLTTKNINANLYHNKVLMEVKNRVSISLSG